MAYEKDIVEEVKHVQSLKTLVEVFGEIASVRMMKIRDTVLKNRDYLEAINSIFRDSLATYASKLSKLVRRGSFKKGGRVTFLGHNGKTVVVLISANTGFFGEVVQATFKKFIEDTKNQNMEVTIIGRLGRSLFTERMPKTPYTYFNLPDFGIDRKKLSEAVRHLVQYEEIRIYYGKYQSVITQKPTMSLISSGTSIGEYVAEPEVKYIFEPNVEKILMFFESEIFASLFDQSIRESQLAKYASRILAMDRAGENIRDNLKSLNLERLKISHEVANRKQLNSLSSVMYSGKR
jgi:ATP synthase F1 gamma subunit